MKKRHYAAMLAIVLLFCTGSLAVGMKVVYPDLSLEDWISALGRDIDEKNFPRPNKPPVPLKR